MERAGSTAIEPGAASTGRRTGAVTVVIPYFQRRPGLLARALDSMLAQEDAGEVRAVVVDDGSPSPAAADVATLPAAGRERVRVLEQPNAGPGAARNRALDALGPDTELVAFLDSDDAWHPEHLARARRGLAAADVYAANWMPLEADVDAYTHYRRLDLAEHEPLGDDLWRYRGDFFGQELSRPIGRLSTLVFARAPFADLRFDPRLRCAFEDRLFRLRMAERSPRVVFSMRPEATSGEGVNVFSSRGWGTPGRLEVARDELFAARLVRRGFALRPEHLTALRAKVRSERRDAWTTWLRLLLRERALHAPKLARLIAADPLWPLAAPLAALRRG